MARPLQSRAAWAAAMEMVVRWYFFTVSPLVLVSGLMALVDDGTDENGVNIARLRGAVSRGAKKGSCPMWWLSRCKTD
jgi:hypothetical protein